MEQISQSPPAPLSSVLCRLPETLFGMAQGAKKKKRRRKRQQTDSNLPMIHCKEMQRRRERERQEVSIYLGKEVPPVNPSHPSARLPRQGAVTETHRCTSLEMSSK